MAMLDRIQRAEQSSSAKSGYWESVLHKVESTLTTVDACKVDQTLHYPIYLEKLGTKISGLQAALQEGHVSRLGKFSLQREIAVLNNQIVSARTIIKSEQLRPSTFSSILEKFRSTLGTIINEISMHHQFRSAQVVTPAKPAMPKFLQTSNGKIFHNLEEAARELRKLTPAKPEEKTERKLVSVGSMLDVRESQAFQSLKQYQDDKTKLKNMLDKGAFDYDAPFAFVKAPILLITESPIPTKHLQAANIPFLVVPNYNISFGVAPNSANRDKADSYTVVLENQLLAAIILRVPTPANASPPVKKGKTPATTEGYTQINLALTRQDMPDILKMRTGKTYIDVLQRAVISKEEKNQYIAHKDFKFQFVWYMPENIFAKLGRLNIKKISFPF